MKAVNMDRLHILISIGGFDSARPGDRGVVPDRENRYACIVLAISRWRRGL